MSFDLDTRLTFRVTDWPRSKAGLSPRRREVAELRKLVRGVRAVVARHIDWSDTANLVADQLRRQLPGPDVLPPDRRAGDAAGYRSYVLHSEPDGSFSIVALVWRPGQMTRVHDHVTWCVFGVVQGIEYEELFTIDESGSLLVPAGTSVNRVGEVTGFAPPGDIHRVRNAGEEVAISIHVYGTDVARIGSSVRRYYDLPLPPTAAAA